MESTERYANKMERRGFVRAVTVGTVAGLALGPVISASASERSQSQKQSTIRKMVLMKVGCQSGETTIDNLEFKARNGVFNKDNSIRLFPNENIL
jgi:mannonate dehydratase